MGWPYTWSKLVLDLNPGGWCTWYWLGWCFGTSLGGHKSAHMRAHASFGAQPSAQTSSEALWITKPSKASTKHSNNFCSSYS